MKKANELFPNDERWFRDYQPIIDSFGEVIIQVDDDGYQGDTRAVLLKDGKFGFLNFGWGSCSGCDSLQRCNTYKEVDELIEFLYSEIKWFDSFDELKKYINHPDRKGSYYYHVKEWVEFINKVNSYEDNHG